MSTPTTTTPWSRQRRAICSTTGASARHGAHQVAQKSRSTAWPRRSLSRRDFVSPFGSADPFATRGRLKGGASCPIAAGGRREKTMGTTARSPRGGDADQAHGRQRVSPFICLPRRPASTLRRPHKHGRSHGPARRGRWGYIATLAIARRGDRERVRRRKRHDEGRPSEALAAPDHDRTVMLDDNLLHDRQT